MTCGRPRRARLAALVLAAACCACAVAEPPPHSAGAQPQPVGTPTSAVSAATGEASADGTQPDKPLPQSSASSAGAAPGTQPAAPDSAEPQQAAAATPTSATASREGEDVSDGRAAAQQRRGLVRVGAGHGLAGDPEGWPGPAPQWPFDGVVQLAWGSRSDRRLKRVPEGWFLRFYEWHYDSGSRRSDWFVSHVELPEMRVECAGKTGLVADGPDGLVVGGLPGAVSASYRVPWGGTAVALDAPPEALLDEIQHRPSNIETETAGDHVRLEGAEQAVRFALREPARSDGAWWNAQARHDGDVAVVFVHPARHECLSGITWLIAAHSGEVLACGADTAATRWVSSGPKPDAQLVLPTAASFPGYLSCAFPLDPHILRQGPPQ